MVFTGKRKSIDRRKYRIRIGISPDAENWRYLTFRPTDINSTWIHHWSDYPSLATTDKYLYISMNMFKHQPFTDPFCDSNCFTHFITNLMNSTSTGPIYDYYHDSSLPNSAHTFTLVQGAKNTMYWGIHLTNNLMRLYEWSDSMSPTSVKSFDRNVPAWMPLTRGDGGCTGPIIMIGERGQSKLEVLS